MAPTYSAANGSALVFRHAPRADGLRLPPRVGRRRPEPAAPPPARDWISENEYRLGVALSQIMPGPLTAQLAIALGYFQHGVLGATVVGLAFVLPSFFMVVALSVAYVRFGGLWWMQALFYGIGAAVIAIIAIAAYKLAKSTNKRDPMMWRIFGGLLALTIWARAELAEFFVVAGLVTLFARTRPNRRQAVISALGGAAALAIIIVAERWLASVGVGNQHVLLQVLAFFTKAGAFVFGSGLAIVPFLHQGVVQQFGWLKEQQFVDAVAVAMITPGAVVITVVFIGYLVAGVRRGRHGRHRHLLAGLSLHDHPGPVVQSESR